MIGVEEHYGFPDHRKRKRRRRANRLPVSGSLHLSDHLKGNVGLISSDLVSELFRHRLHPHTSDRLPSLFYIGIAPWTPLAYGSVEDSTWTVVPVESQPFDDHGTSMLKPKTIQISTTSPGLRSLAVALQASPFGKSETGNQSGFEVRMIDVEPLKLSTIYVGVDGDALDKHLEVQKKFGGGFLGAHANGYASKGKRSNKIIANGHAHTLAKSPSSNLQDDSLTAAVREALNSSLVARQGDLLLLPLPAHPITHTPLPPAEILYCEPVDQGLPMELTRIVVRRSSRRSSQAAPLVPIPPLRHFASSKSLTDFDTTDGDGTSNEAFHSAAESGGTSGSESREGVSESDELDRDSACSSEDSDDNMISMATPSLAMHSSGTMSSRIAATPRAHSSGMHGVSTPGSIFSNMTTTTARHGPKSSGKLFMIQSLLMRIPDEIIYPRPAPDEDDECRIFVDIKSLVRLGCFSGDWVKIEPEAKSHGPFGPLPFASPNENIAYRCAKIYGVPDLQPTPIGRSAGGMPQMVQPLPGSQGSLLTAWLSPILLANMGQADTARISPLLDLSYERTSTKSRSSRKKIESTATPAVAREMTLLRVASPLSTERAVQAGLFTALKRYFEEKRRIVHQGDLVALRVDVKSSRLLAQSAQAVDPDDDIDEILTLPGTDQASAVAEIEIAWFKVGEISSSEPLEASDMTSDIWNGAACIEPRTTRMRQTGNEQCKTPAQSATTWRYYLGLRPFPAGSTAQRVRNFIAPVPQPYASAVRCRLRDLIAAATSPRALYLRMGPAVILLHSTQRHIGKAFLAAGAASDLGIHTFCIDAYDLLAEGAGGGDVKTEAFLRARVDRALSCGAAFTSILLQHVEALTADRMVTAIKEVVGEVRVLICTTTELDKIPEGIRGTFTHELDVSAPDEGEREGLLRDILQERGIRIASEVDLSAIAVKTAALVVGNLVDVVERAVVARQERLERIASFNVLSPHSSDTQTIIRDVWVSGGEGVRCLTKADFDLAVEAARKNFADAIGAPKIPNVSWDDVGGLENVKDAVMETIQLPLERPELFAKGMKKRSGILFYGPPGTGKTLLAKAIATEFSLNFFSIKGPELLNMYIGESEANVRRVFQRARDARPCVVFFDELDSVAPKRGNQGDSGGVMDRIVSQLLAELDGMSDGEEGGGGVFVIGATNRPDLLDQALLRPGRFDKMLYLGVSDTHGKQLTILEALTRKFTMHPEISLRRVAESLPFTYTGADLYALCSDAMLKAITRQASAVDSKIKALSGGPVSTAYFFDHLAIEEDIAVMVTEEDFGNAQRELVGSVSAKELEHYQRVRRDFEGPSKPKHNNGLPTAAPTRIPAPTHADQQIDHSNSTTRPSPPKRNSTAKARPTAETKSKGKATRWDSDEDDDEAYVTSNDFATPERQKSRSNSRFGIVGQDDDGELYT